MDTAMDFEITMRILFGEKAYHIADEHGAAKSRRSWIAKAIRLLTREVDSLDTTERHRQMLMGELEAISALTKKHDDPSWDLVYSLIRFASRLLGFDYVRGARCHTPTYWRTTGQNLNSVVFEGGDVMQDYYDKKNAVAIRRAVVQSLRAQGLDDYKIALVLNITEFQVKKLRALPAHEAEEAGDGLYPLHRADVPKAASRPLARRSCRTLGANGPQPQLTAHLRCYRARHRTALLVVSRSKGQSY